jgi:tetratricopeptide (TPR) repeat protein
VVRWWISEGAVESRLCAQLDACICFTGDWAATLQLVTAVEAAGHELTSIRAQLYAGTVLCAQGDARGLRLYKAITVAANPATSHMARIRLAAAQLKRFGLVDEAIATIESAQASCERWSVDGLISRGDAVALAAVGHNLRALAELRAGRRDAAFEFINRACSAHDENGFVVLDGDSVERYRAQARVNHVQLLWLRGDYAGAMSAIRRHVARTRNAHPYSLSEALSVAGQLHYSGGLIEEAVSFLAEAEALLRREATPVRLQKCRKILAGALHRLGDIEERDKVLVSITADPLGMEDLAVAA